jgi:hypothetical protein
VGILCSNKRCGQEGVVEWAENENPIDGLDRDLIRISEGFSRRKGDPRRDPDLTCDTCRCVAYISKSNQDTGVSFASTNRRRVSRRYLGDATGRPAVPTAGAGPAMPSP